MLLATAVVVMMYEPAGPPQGDVLLREGFSLGSIGRTITQLPKKITKPVQKGFQQAAKGLRMVEQKIVGGFKKMQQGMKKMEQSITKQVQKIGAAISKVEATFKKLFNTITQLINKIVKFVSGIVGWIGGYVKCGTDKLLQMPHCWHVYVLEMLGQRLYAPIRLLVWAFRLQRQERQVWALVDFVDETIYDVTKRWNSLSAFHCPADPWSQDPVAVPASEVEGTHVFYWSDETRRRCLQCKINTKLPSF
jgi:hypothetical protein